MVYVVIGITVALLGLWLWLNYWDLSKARNALDAAWSRVDTSLKSRHQLIEKLQQSARAEFKQEPELLVKLEVALAAAQGTTSREQSDRQIAEEKLGEALGQFLSALERHQEVLGAEPYNRLRDEIVSVEDELTVGRQQYNSLCVRFNMQLSVFPASLFASKLGMQPAAEFHMDDAFDRYPLKIKPTLPTPRRSLLLEEETGPAQSNPKE